MLADALDLAERDVVAPADEQHLALVGEGLEVADDVDGVGLAEREIEDDQIRDRRLEVGEQGRRRRELARLETDRGDDLAHDRTNLRLVIQDKGEPPGGIRTWPGRL
jgi:hypothetical protein